MSSARAPHVHDVHVECLPVVSQIDRDTARRDVDEHREQQDLAVSGDVQRDCDDRRLNPVAAQHIAGDAEIRDQQFPSEEGRQTERVNGSPHQRRWHHATTAQEREDGVTDDVADQQVRQGDLTLQRGPREREEDAAQ